MSPLEPRGYMPPLRGTITSDAVVELSLGEVAYVLIECPSGSVGSLEFLGEAGDMDGEVETLPPGANTGWMDIQDRTLRLKRSGGDAGYTVKRIGYHTRQG